MAIVLLCSGCATVIPSEQPASTSYHLGLVKVVGMEPGDQTRVTGINVQTFGLRIMDGLTLGYVSEKTFRAPSDCRVVVIVRTDAQLRQARALLNSLKGEKLCAAQQD